MQELMNLSKMTTLRSKLSIKQSLEFKINEDSSMIRKEAVIEGFCATSSDVGGN
jgi:hypothetical protein